MSLHIAIVGATGAVGREMIASVLSSSLPISKISLLASARSEGKKMMVGDEEVTVRTLTNDAFEGVDLALFSAGGGRSLEFAPAAVKAGCVVVDNSSAWRMDPEVPLVVPEVNPDALADHKGIIANPNCSTIQMVLPLMALHKAAGLKRVIVSTYQSAAGAGQAGIDELWAGAKAALADEPLPAKTFSRPLAFDAIPQIGDFTDTGYTTEERKMLYETRKILGLPELASSATCVRVPVARGHLESVTADLERPLSAAAAKEAIAAFPGVVLKDDPANMDFPVARDCVGRTETFVGRVRVDEVLPNTIHFWVVSDNLLKGAATNAVQIAEALNDNGLVRVP
jgi:aspartate-semialdehyde dehydrogenase